MLQLGRQLRRDNRSEPLAVLREVYNLTTGGVMRRVGDLARCVFERNLAHATTVRQRSASDRELPYRVGLAMPPLRFHKPGATRGGSQNWPLPSQCVLEAL